MQDNEADHDEQTQIVPFPPGRETPQTAEVDVDGQPVTVIYLPWPHDVDGEQRSAGVYYQASQTAGFYPAPTERDLDVLLEEMVPQLRRHLHLVPDPDKETAR